MTEINTSGKKKKKDTFQLLLHVSRCRFYIGWSHPKGLSADSSNWNLPFTINSLFSPFFSSRCHVLVVLFSQLTQKPKATEDEVDHWNKINLANIHFQKNMAG